MNIQNYNMNGSTPIQTTNPNLTPFYQNLNRSLFHGESEKSFIDKVLGRQDADKLHNLIKKEPLTLSDVEEILFLMTSIDQKLLNYSEWDRYITCKLFPWIKDFSIVCKQIMIYQTQYETGDFDEDFTIEGKIKIKSKEDKIVEIDGKPILEETKRILKESNKIALHYFKFLISTFLLINNTTLSIEGSAFDTITTSKFEYNYPTIPLPQPQEKRPLLNIFKSKR